ncbi:hypothetical protein [Acinetobacter puyangensis]|uniref:hypothetical protein n=1 Tax=Acinetobacter puyangensis TaxID=1096779 RepID=UPI003A4E5318
MAFYRNCFTRLFYFISIIFILSNNAYATEYWKTSITYTETNLTAKGRKTNYETQLYVDDVIKKASLQFSENVKEKIGITAKDRIFNNLDRDGQYSSLASQDIISLLKLKDYKIDYDEKEIYLLKNTDGSVNCKNFFYKWKNPQGAEYKCPIDAANSRIEARCTGLITNCEVGDLYADQYFTTKILD